MSNTKKADILFLIIVANYLGVTFCITLIHLMGININLSINQRLILSQLLILTPVAIYLVATKTNPVKLIRFKRIDVPTILMVILFVILMMPLVTFINALSMLFSHNLVVTLSEEMSGNSFFLNLILMAVIPAISEEFVFRGVLFHTYRKYSVLYGIIISGVLFGFMHMNFNQFSYVFVLGIIFALLIEATGSIYTTMIAHFIVNGNSVLSMAISNLMARLGQSSQVALQNQITTQSLMMVIAVYGMISLGTTALAIAVYIWIVKHCKRENHMRAVFLIRKGVDRFDIKKVISIPLILSILICLGYMIYSEAALNMANNEDSYQYNNIENVDDNTL